MRFSILLFFAATMGASAQIVSFGVKAGVPATNGPFASRGAESRGSDSSGHWIVGPTVDFHLTSALSIEIDALYRAYNVRGQGQVRLPSDTDPTSFSYRLEVKAWDFPLLLKYRFLEGPVRPFVNAGISLTHETMDVTNNCSGPRCFSSFNNYTGLSKINSNRRGEVAGGGVEFRYGRLKIAPEVRYTRLSNPGANQVSVLAGFTF